MQAKGKLRRAGGPGPRPPGSRGLGAGRKRQTFCLVTRAQGRRVSSSSSSSSTSSSPSSSLVPPLGPHQCGNSGRGPPQGQCHGLQGLMGLPPAAGRGAGEGRGAGSPQRGPPGCLLVEPGPSACSEVVRVGARPLDVGGLVTRAAQPSECAGGPRMRKLIIETWVYGTELAGALFIDLDPPRLAEEASHWAERPPPAPLPGLK